jgi:hypothetical protein
MGILGSMFFLPKRSVGQKKYGQNAKVTPQKGPRQRPRRVPKGRRRPASVASGQTASLYILQLEVNSRAVT